MSRLTSTSGGATVPPSDDGWPRDALLGHTRLNYAIDSRVQRDPVLVDIIGSQLLAIAEEMGLVLVRTAYSPNIKERQDCSAALLDEAGMTTAQAEHIPLHMGSMLGLIPELRRRHGHDLHPGDIFISNDPYMGGSTHLPDITVATPLIYDGELLGFAATVAHHTEVGGSFRGARDVFEEGLRIPPTRIGRGGEVDQQVLDLILANCRAGDERLGDLRSQFASVGLGARRFGELIDRYGVATVRSARELWLNKAELQARLALSALPAGRYSFTDFMDDDGAGRTDLQITVEISVDANVLLLDFSKSSEQTEGPINVVYSALLATVYFAIKSALDPELPANSGYYRIVEVRARPGSIVHASSPAAVLWRSDTCQRIVDVIFGALAQALPERIPAAANGSITGILFAGWDDIRQRFFSYIETIGGGFGARPTSNGPDAVQAHLTNTSNLPVEVLEHEYPLRVELYALREGSGGTGCFSGGLGIVRDVRVLAQKLHFRTKGDRTVRPPWGLSGGGAGAPSRFVLNPGTAEECVVGAKYSTELRRSDVARVMTAGGGGYGELNGADEHSVQLD